MTCVLRVSSPSEQYTETERELGSAVVVAQTDRLGEVRHPVVAAVDADREGPRDVKIDTRAEMTSDSRLGAVAREDVIDDFCPVDRTVVTSGTCGRLLRITKNSMEPCRAGGTAVLNGASV